MSKDLIARLEKATFGSRELDAEIHVTVFGWKLAKVGPDYDGQNTCEVYTGSGKLYEGFAYPPKGRISPYYHVPDVQYTRSVDAALTLVLAPRGGVKLYMPDGVQHGAFIQDAEYPGVWHTGHAATPALALCIAALRARATQEK